MIMPKASRKTSDGHSLVRTKTLAVPKTNVSATLMTPSQWAEVPDNPRQRDTEDHARKAMGNHLKDYSSSHVTVHMAALPDGSTYKLDGHTRSFLWEAGVLEAPETILVVQYSVGNIETVMAMYRHHDSNEANETSTEKLTGAYRQHSIPIQSGLLRGAGVITAMRNIHAFAKSRSSKEDLYSMVPRYEEPLLAVDKFTLKKSKFSWGLVMAMLMTTWREGAKAQEFWEAYSNDEGIKKGAQRDAVQALTEAVQRNKEGDKGKDAAIHLCGQALNAYEGWKADKMYGKSALKSRDPKAYVDRYINRRLM